MNARCCGWCLLFLTVVFTLGGMVFFTYLASYIKNGKYPCNVFPDCYYCTASPCSALNYWNNTDVCGGFMCVWAYDNVTLPYETGDVSGCTSVNVENDPNFDYPDYCDVNTSVKSNTLFIALYAVAGASVLIMLWVMCCCGRKSKNDDRASQLRWEAANSSDCGECHHDKHHGRNCSEMVNNRKATCTCNHNHHKGTVCNETIHYNEYRTERKVVPVRKSRTKYKTESKRVAVTKYRTKYVDRGRWVQKPYGPGNGTYSVYEPNNVAERESYTDYEYQDVQTPYTEYYTVNEEQDVQIPIPKTRPCTCVGQSCNCFQCVKLVPCGCDYCDCKKCAEKQEKGQAKKRKRRIAKALLVTLAVNAFGFVFFVLLMFQYNKLQILTANQYKFDWIYNLDKAAQNALIPGWAGAVVYNMCVLILLFMRCTHKPDEEDNDDDEA